MVEIVTGCAPAAEPMERVRDTPTRHKSIVKEGVLRPIWQAPKSVVAAKPRYISLTNIMNDFSWVDFRHPNLQIKI